MRCEGRSHRKIPDVAVRAAILGGTGARVPRPLMHADEANAGILLHQLLRAIAVVHVPVNDQYTLGTMLLSRVVRADADVAEETETHRRAASCVVARWTHGAEAAQHRPIEGEVDSVEHAAGSGRCGIPAAWARHGVGIEVSSAAFHDGAHRLDITRVVRQREFVGRCMAAFAMFDRVKQVEVVAQRARNCTQTADMFRMIPSSVVTSAI